MERLGADHGFVIELLKTLDYLCATEVPLSLYPAILSLSEKEVKESLTESMWVRQEVLDILEFREKETPTQRAFFACETGKLGCLRYMKDYGDMPRLSREMMIHAIGHPEVMEWLHEKGCPMDAWVFCKAVKKGDERAVRWLYEKGCPMDGWLGYYDLVVERGRSDWLAMFRDEFKWAITPRGEEGLFLYMVRLNRVEMMEWCFQNGWTIPDLASIMRTVFERGPGPSVVPHHALRLLANRFDVSAYYTQIWEAVYWSKSSAELKKLCKERGEKGGSTSRKPTLIHFLVEDSMNKGEKPF
jgi:hypothetical protein